jgi:DNA (cytosine-5)-methyltransferase 1
MSRPVALDLFSCGAGAGRGYRLAGFRRVICIDNADHEASVIAAGCEFHRMDWREGLEKFGHLADLIHASPPCQHDSIMTQCRPGVRDEYPDLTVPVIRALEVTGKPWVVEQPESSAARAKMGSPVMLCGTAYGLAVEIGGRSYELRRHRLFASNLPLTGSSCDHRLRAFPLYGHGYPGNRRQEFRGLEFASAARAVMGIDWTTGRRELTEALPPVFTQDLGRQFMALAAGWARAA